MQFHKKGNVRSLFYTFPLGEGGRAKKTPTKPALWGEEQPRYSRNFPLAENGAL